jgi:hypothetical protein
VDLADVFLAASFCRPGVEGLAPALAPFVPCVLPIFSTDLVILLLLGVLLLAFGCCFTLAMLVTKTTLYISGYSLSAQ